MQVIYVLNSKIFAFFLDQCQMKSTDQLFNGIIRAETRQLYRWKHITYGTPLRRDSRLFDLPLKISYCSITLIPKFYFEQI